MRVATVLSLTLLALDIGTKGALSAKTGKAKAPVTCDDQNCVLNKPINTPCSPVPGLVAQQPNQRCEEGSLFQQDEVNGKKYVIETNYALRQGKPVSTGMQTHVPKSLYVQEIDMSDSTGTYVAYRDDRSRQKAETQHRNNRNTFGKGHGNNRRTGKN